MKKKNLFIVVEKDQDGDYFNINLVRGTREEIAKTVTKITEVFEVQVDFYKADPIRSAADYAKAVSRDVEEFLDGG